MYRRFIGSLFAAAILLVSRADAQDIKPPTAAEVKAAQARYQAERDEVVKSGIARRFQPILMEKAEDLAQKASKALADGRLLQASEGFRQARWMLPYQTPQTPAKHVALILGSMRLRHDGGVNAIAFSPDGKLLASASRDHTVKIWDLDNGRELLTYTGHGDIVKAIAFSPDGKTIASGASEPNIRLWDPLTGKEKQTIPAHGAYVTALTYTQDGKYLFSGQQGKTEKDSNYLCVHETDKGKLIRSVDDFRALIDSLNFSPNGSTLAVGSSDGQVRLFDYPRMVNVPTQPAYWSQQDSNGAGFHVTISPDNRTMLRCGLDGVKLYNLPMPGDKAQPLEPRSKPIASGSSGAHHRANCAIYSRDGKTIIVGCSDGLIRMYDADSAQPAGVHRGHSGEIRMVCMSPNGSFLASASSDNTIRIWQNETATQSRDFVGHDGPVWKSSFSPDGKLLVSASADRTVRIWDVPGGKVLHVLTGHDAPVTSARFSNDGRFVASAGGDKVIKIWDSQSGKLVRELAGHQGTVTTLDFAGDGTRLVSGSVDRKVKVWDFQAGKELLNIDNGTVPAAVAFSPDGKQIATGNVDQSIKFYEAGTGKTQASWSAHGTAVTGIAYSPNGLLLASSGADQLARVWTVAKPGVAPVTMIGHNGPVSCVAFRKDNQHVASCGSDMSVKLWKLEGDAGKEVQTFRGHKDWITSVAFSKDGFYVVSSGVDRLIKINEITTRDSLLVSEPNGAVLSVAVSADGKYIASGSTDSTIKIWDRATGAELATLVGHAEPISALVFTADSKQLISGSLDQTMKLWDVGTAKELPRQGGHQMNWTALDNAPPLLALAADNQKVFVWEPGRQGKERFTKISCYNIANGAEVFTFTDGGREVQAVSFSANGKLAAAAAKDGSVRIFDLDKKGQIIPGGDWFVFDKEGMTGDVALSPDGAFLAAASTKGELKIGKLAGKQILHTIQAHEGHINACLISPDGKRIATAGQDNVIKLWDLAKGTELRSWNMQVPGDANPRRSLVMNIAFTPDSRQLISANANTTLFVLELP